MYRRQASLYVLEQVQVEALRQIYNPVQARLIPPHVTLCREDEVTDWHAFKESLELHCPFELILEFGSPIRDNDFVYLPVWEGVDEFHALRRAVLGDEPRKHNPHLTLIHPRSGKCTDQDFEAIRATISPFRFTFREVTLIEQEGDGVWNVVERIALRTTASR